jgi:hypothetical protein
MLILYFLRKKHCFLGSVYCLMSIFAILTRVNFIFWRMQYHGEAYFELLSNPKALSSDRLSLLIRKIRIHYNFPHATSYHYHLIEIFLKEQI